jgi:hypothetical protein
MKKKGLIISTIVMVVVLIASLTTATYAWFSQSASAAIEAIDVRTAASEGLQIAVYDTSGNFTSGSTELSELVWRGTSDGWGESLSFNMEATKFYAVSGNGQSMYSPNNANEAVSENKITNTSVMKTAVANGEYFVANIALTNTKAAADSVIISNLSITPVPGGAANTAGICDAMRIAVFTRTAADGEATLKFVLNPYSNVSYSKSSRQFSISTEADQTAFLKFESFTSGTTTYASHTTDTFASAKYIKGAKAALGTTLNATTGPNALLTYARNDIVTGTTRYDDTDQYFNFGSVASNEVLYLQFVIWFEGEDPDCINAFAGGGATVSMNFGFKSDPDA